jgi:hypothetical protein
MKGFFFFLKFGEMFSYKSMKGSVSKATLIITFAWERRKNSEI